MTGVPGHRRPGRDTRWGLAPGEAGGRSRAEVPWKVWAQDEPGQELLGREGGK